MKRTEYMKQYRAEHAEQIAAYHHAWVEKNRDKLNEKRRIYYQNHKEELCAVKKAKRKEQKEKLVLFIYHGRRLKISITLLDLYEGYLGRPLSVDDIDEVIEEQYFQPIGDIISGLTNAEIVTALNAYLYQKGVITYEEDRNAQA